MTAVPKTILTEAQYLAIERTAAFKSEFFEGEMFAMAGANYAHNAITENLSVEIGIRLKGSPCRTFSRDMRVKVSRTGLYTYPDNLIVCGKAELEEDTLLNPQVICEVLSDSTESYDRGTKFLHYRRIPALREYVLVSQNQKLIERFVRQPDNDWLLTTFDNPEAEFALTTAPISVPIADVYRGVELPDEPLR